MVSLERIAQNTLGEADLRGMGMQRTMPAYKVAVSERGATPVAEYSCEVATRPEELARLRAQWAHLAARAATDTQLFQSPFWSDAWVAAFHDIDARNCSPLVVVVRDAGGAPVLVWPLMRVRYSLNVTVITWLSDPYGQYGDVITSLRGAALRQALETALEAIAREGADLVRLKFVREDAVIAPFLKACFRQTGESYGAPWLDLTPYAKPDDLEGRYTRTQRRRRRKIQKRLEKHLGADISFRRLTDLDEIRAAIPVLLENKREWLRGRGLVSRALFHDRAEDFLLRLAEGMGAERKGPEFVLTVTEAGGRQLSWEVGFRWKRRHYAYITAHLPELTDFSIGRLHMHLAQRLAVADGMRVFDLLVPAAPHKKSWSSDVTPVHNHFLPLTLRGRLLGQAYLCHLRPMLRDIYHRLPAGVRSFLHLSDLHEHDEGVTSRQNACDLQRTHE